MESLSESVAGSSVQASANRGGKRETPFSLLKSKEKVSDELLLDAFMEYNQTIGSRDCCVNRTSSNPKFLQCNCGEILADNQEYCMAVAEFQVFFGKESKVHQQRIVIEWMRVAHLLQHSTTRRKYSIPFLTPEGCNQEVYEGLRTTGVCASTLMDILGVGKKWWLTCLVHSTNNSLPQHKLKGQPSNIKRKWNEVFEEGLIEHFEDLREDSGPIATRFVRERTGEITSRDDNDSNEYLSPNWSKRRCYAKYCRSRGVEILTNNKGTIQKRPAAGGGGMQDVPSWSTYLSFWNKHYPNLKVSRPAEDICPYCYVFHNLHKYKQQGPMPDDASPPAPPPNLSLTQQEVVATSMIEQDHFDEEDVSSDIADVSEATLTSEQAILDAANHVRMARAQRELVNAKVQAAREDSINAVDHFHRTYTFIVDYGQNMELPFFGGSQPGDTYYYTPLNIFNLGFVDVADARGDHLYCHLYREGDGKKGGNNVASLVMKSLHMIGLLQQVNGKELNIVFDNCAGQNKNHHVLWLVPYLVEMGYFRSVNFIFLVVGHTKNAADRRFNNLKMVFRKSNVTSFQKLVDVCNSSEFVTVWEVNDGDFRDYHSYLGLFYADYKSVKPNHIFSCSRFSDDCPYKDNTSLIVTTRVSNLEQHAASSSDAIKKNFLEFSEYDVSFDEAVAARKQWLSGIFPPDNLPFAGVPPFKQCELYFKYRKHIPLEDRDATCPRPSDEVLNSQKADKKQRAKVKKEAKMKVVKKLKG
jgi:hypothetical protein